MNPSTHKPFNFFSGPKPRVIGHRGAKGEAPENTLPSFERALADGAGLVELDVRGSADGEVAIIHDATVGRTANGHGRVSRLSLRELKRLDAGYWFTKDGGATYPYRGHGVEIPTLAELFSILPQIRAIIEIKQTRPPIVKQVIEAVCRAGKEHDVLLATEENQIMGEIRTELRESGLSIPTGFCYGEVEGFMAWLAGNRRETYYPPGQAMQLPCEFASMTLVSEQTINGAHDLGVEMYAWTINELAEMERLVRLGVDGIITDYPGRLGVLVAEK